MQKWNNTDKSDWIDGEWKNEPDKCQWIDEKTGLDCLIVRGPTGALCGYVGVPKSHRFYGKSYNDLVTLEVHGGLTFSNKCQRPGSSRNVTASRGICHTGDMANKIVWWLGFDCAHAGDVTPGYQHNLPPQLRLSWPGDTYKNIDYVKREVESLAKQLAEGEQ